MVGSARTQSRRSSCTPTKPGCLAVKIAEQQCCFKPAPFCVRLRLVSLAAQKFLANVSHESLQIYKQRRRQTQARLKEQGLKDQKVVLTMEDTAVALQEVRSLLLLH